MRTLKIILSILFCISLFFQAHGKMFIPNQGFEAHVSSFSGKWVKVFYKGKIWRVPRSSVANPKAVKIGKKVEVVLTKQDLKKVKVQNPKPAKKQNTKVK